MSGIDYADPYKVLVHYQRRSPGHCFSCANSKRGVYVDKGKERWGSYCKAELEANQSFGYPDASIRVCQWYVKK